MATAAMSETHATVARSVDAAPRPALRLSTSNAWLAPFRTQPVGLLLGAVGALVACCFGDAGTATIGLTFAAVLVVGVLVCREARSPIAVEGGVTRWLDNFVVLIGGVALLVWVGKGFGRDLWWWWLALDSELERAMLALTVVVPGGAGAAWVYHRSARQRGPMAPDARAWLFGHDRGRVLLWGAIRVFGPVMALLGCYVLASVVRPATLGNALAAVEDLRDIVDGPLPSKSDSTVGWKHWTERPDLQRIAVARRLPRLLEELDDAAMVEAWLAPVLPVAARRKGDRHGRAALSADALRAFAEASRPRKVESPHDAVIEGLYATCDRLRPSAAGTTNPGDAVRVPCEALPLREDPLADLGIDDRQRARRVVGSALRKGRALQPLLGGWARAHRLCDSASAVADPSRQLESIFHEAVCGGTGGHSHVRRQLAAFGAADDGQWQIPRPGGDRLRLRTRSAGCGVGPTALELQSAGAIRSVEGLMQRVAPGSASTPTDGRRAIHLWGVEQDDAVWLGAVVLDSEAIESANCLDPAAALCGAGKVCRPLNGYGIRVASAAAPGGRGLKIVRISPTVPDCSSIPRSRGCLAPEVEGRTIARLTWSTGPSGSYSVAAAKLLDGSWALGRKVDTSRALRALKPEGRTTWLAGLLARPGEAPPEQISIVFADETVGAVHARRQAFDANAKEPVVRFVVSAKAMASAAAGAARRPGSAKAAGKKPDRCEEFARRLNFVQPDSDAERWHEVPAPNRWYGQLLGGKPNSAVCVLAPLTAHPEVRP